MESGNASLVVQLRYVLHDSCHFRATIISLKDILDHGAIPATWILNFRVSTTQLMPTPLERAPSSSCKFHLLLDDSTHQPASTFQGSHHELCKGSGFEGSGSDAVASAVLSLVLSLSLSFFLTVFFFLGTLTVVGTLPGIGVGACKNDNL